jgi:hypothetical protein
MKNPPTTSDPIQVSSDLESPHKRLREVSAEELEPHRKTKSEPTSPHKPPVTPTSQMPTQILKLIDFLHLSRDPSPPLRYLIILQPLKSTTGK